MKRSEATQLIQDYKERLFNPLLDRQCVLTFGSHTITGVKIENVLLAKTTGLKNAPDKRLKEDKNYTPLLMEIKTSSGSLLFVIEDTTIAQVLNGTRLTIGEVKVELRLV